MIGNSGWFQGAWQWGILLEALFLQAGYLALWRWRWRAKSGSGTRALWSFSGAVWLFFFTFGSPLDALADHVGFAYHMLQHVAETMWIAPLFLAGIPDGIWQALASHAKAAQWLRAGMRPVGILLLFNLVFAASHIPALYNWVLGHEGWHLGEHVLFFAVAVGLWWPLLCPREELGAMARRRHQLLYLFANNYCMMPLSAILLIAGRPWYLADAAAGHRVLTTVGQQQWGAILMMLGMFFTYLAMGIRALYRPSLGGQGTVTLQ